MLFRNPAGGISCRRCPRRLVPRPLDAADDPHPRQVVERQGDGEQVVRFGGCARCRECQAARRRRFIRRAGVRVGERARRLIGIPRRPAIVDSLPRDDSAAPRRASS
jgi:hypothetical protein